MTETFAKIWFAFVAALAVAWIAFLIWGGVQIIDILRGLAQ